MGPFEKIKRYSNDVCQQIRWKKIRPMIATEIEHHICDQRDGYMSSGDDESIATDKAILQMGDPVSIGQKLNQTHNPKSQWFMVGLTGILMLIGLFVNYFCGHPLIPFRILPYFLAFFIFLLCYYIDFRILGEHAKTIYFIILFFSLIPLFFSVISTARVDGRLWLHIENFSISLSNLSLIFPLAFALIVYSMKNKGFRGILISGIAYVPLAYILSSIPTMSGLVLYTIIALIALCFAIYRGWFGVKPLQGLLFVLIPAGIVSFLCTLRIINSHYISQRLLVFLNPYSDQLGAGFQFCGIREMISEANFFGEGGVPHMLRDMPQFFSMSTDYSLLYFIHQFGLVTLFCITSLLILFSVFSVYKAVKQKSMLGSLIGITIIAVFILQSVFYIAHSLGYGLFSPIALPFISYGNSALFLNAALIGFMLSIFRTGDIFHDNSIISIEGNGNVNHSIFCYENGKLIITLKRTHV